MGNFFSRFICEGGDHRVANRVIKRSQTHELFNDTKMAAVERAVRELQAPEISAICPQFKGLWVCQRIFELLLRRKYVVFFNKKLQAGAGW